MCPHSRACVRERKRVKNMFLSAGTIYFLSSLFISFYLVSVCTCVIVLSFIFMSMSVHIIFHWDTGIVYISVIHAKMKKNCIAIRSLHNADLIAIQIFLLFSFFTLHAFAFMCTVCIMFWSLAYFDKLTRNILI